MTTAATTEGRWAPARTGQRFEEALLRRSYDRSAAGRGARVPREQAYAPTQCPEQPCRVFTRRAGVLGAVGHDLEAEVTLHQRDAAWSGRRTS
jgi:hypothetical protein